MTMLEQLQRAVKPHIYFDLGSRMWYCWGRVAGVNKHYLGFGYDFQSAYADWLDRTRTTK